MEQTRSFIKLPIKSRGILTTFRTDKDDVKLFKFINEDINSQKTISSKQVRRSQYRGILRNIFHMTDDEMKLIESTEEQKQQYFEKSKQSVKNQKEHKVNLSLFKKIMDLSTICELMIRSGLRISELLENESKINKTVKFKLNKKESNDFYTIHIIGDTQDWIKKYNKMKIDFQDIPAKRIIDALNYKLRKLIPEEEYKKSSHICRALYISYMYKFRKGIYKKWTLPQIISKYLHHENTNASAYYQHIILADDVTDFLS